ncbi:hypothetical protein pb186bvf_010184 [Paramecium bursaria]
MLIIIILIINALKYEQQNNISIKMNSETDIKDERENISMIHNEDLIQNQLKDAQIIDAQSLEDKYYEILENYINYLLLSGVFWGFVLLIFRKLI